MSGIFHNKIVDLENPPDCEDWNNDHNFYGFDLPKLIETYPIPALSSELVIPDLDGNMDINYLLKADFNISQPVDTFIYFNADFVTTNYKQLISYAASGAVNQWSGYGFRVGTSGGSPGRITSKIEILASSGVNRRLTCQSEFADASLDYRFFEKIFGGWINSIDNITQITIKPGSGTFEGSVSLFKLIPLTL